MSGIPRDFASRREKHVHEDRWRCPLSLWEATPTACLSMAVLRRDHSIHDAVGAINFLLLSF